MPFQKIEIGNKESEKKNKIDVLAMEEYGSPLQIKGKKLVTPAEELEESLARMRGCFNIRNQPIINNFDGESTAQLLNMDFGQDLPKNETPQRDNKENNYQNMFSPESNFSEELRGAIVKRMQ